MNYTPASSQARLPMYFVEHNQVFHLPCLFSSWSWWNSFLSSTHWNPLLPSKSSLKANFSMEAFPFSLTKHNPFTLLNYNNILFIFSFSFPFLATPLGLQYLSSLTRDWIRAMAVKELSPNHWTARKFVFFFFFFLNGTGTCVSCIIVVYLFFLVAYWLQKVLRLPYLYL